MKSSQFFVSVCCLLVGLPQGLTKSLSSGCDFSPVIEFADTKEKVTGDMEGTLEYVKRDCEEEYDWFTIKRRTLDEELVAAIRQFSDEIAAIGDKYGRLFKELEKKCGESPSSECKMEFNDAQEKKRMALKEVETTHNAAIQDIYKTLETLVKKFTSTFGDLDKELYKVMSREAYDLKQDFQDMQADVESAMEDISLEFSAGICCEFTHTSGERMKTQEVDLYTGGLRYCFNYALNINGICLEGDIEDVEMESHFSTASRRELRSTHRRLGGYQSSCCVSGSCGYGCSGGGGGSSSGWRQLEESVGVPFDVPVAKASPSYVPRGLSTVDDIPKRVQTSLEECLLGFVNEYIPEIFPKHDDATCMCNSCTLEDCPVISIGAGEIAGMF